MRRTQIVILGRRNDPSARLLADVWRQDGAVLLTAASLSVPGWRHDPQHVVQDRSVIDGLLAKRSSIAAVVNRLHSVEVVDLPHIETRDRAYVAAEMTAFLTVWLSSLDCPQLNQPSAGALCGPAWNRAQWVRRVAQMGLPVEPTRLIARHDEPAASAGASGADDKAARVVVVGQSPAIGDVHPSLSGQAHQIAKAANVDLLEVGFSSADEGGRFQWANPLPHVTPAIAAAMLQHLRAQIGPEHPPQGEPS